MLEAVFEARHELEGPVFAFHFHDVEGARLFGFNETVAEAGSSGDSVAPGQRVRIRSPSRTGCCRGAIRSQCWISRNRTEGDLALHTLRLLEFIVFGTQPGAGSVHVDVDVSSRSRAAAMAEPSDSSCARSAGRPRSAAGGGASPTCSS